MFWVVISKNKINPLGPLPSNFFLKTLILAFVANSALSRKNETQNHTQCCLVAQNNHKFMRTCLATSLGKLVDKKFDHYTSNMETLRKTTEIRRKKLLITYITALILSNFGSQKIPKTDLHSPQSSRIRWPNQKWHGFCVLGLNILICSSNTI